MSEPLQSPSEVPPRPSGAPPPAPGAAAPLSPLSAADAQIFAELFAAAAKSKTPLAPTLRAAAAEFPERRVSTAMIRLATELEAGRSLDSILLNNPRFLPSYMQRLIEAGARSGNLPDVLIRLIEIDRTSADLRRGVRIAIAYPIVLVVLWLCLFSLFAAYVVPDLIRVLRDLKLQLPLQTRLLAALSGKWMVNVLGFLAAAIPMLVISFRILRRPLGWQRMLTEIPLFGLTLLWRGVASWCRLLSLLLRNGTPLPDALRLASNGVYAPIPTSAGLRAARGVEMGKTLGDALAQARLMPATLLPFVRWGEEHSALPESLDTAAEMFERRIELRAALMRTVLPPIVFIGIALGALWLANAMIMPMMVLYRSMMRWSGPATPLGADEIEERIMMGVTIMTAIWFVATVLIVLLRSALGGFLYLLASQSSGSSGRWNPFFDVLRVGYWIMTMLVLLVAMVTLAGVPGFILWLAAVTVLIMFTVRYREMERRSLLWMLAVAMDKRVPLAGAAHAFADERRDGIGRQTRRLAVTLEGGAPLNRAFSSAGIPLPIDALVAMRIGSHTGGLPELLKSVNGSGALADTATQAATGRVTYLIFLTVFTAAPLGFLCIKIFPAYRKIFADFRAELPTPTLAVMNAVDRFVFSPLGPLFVLFIFAVLFYVVGRYCGLIRWDAPIVRSFTIKLDQALIMRALAQGVAQRQPIPRMLDGLAKQYPKPHIRSRLSRAWTRTSNGANWCDALTSVGLLPNADASVLRSAERVGNLPWALNETAERLSRRFSTRVTTATAIIFPIVLVLLGSITFFASVGMILPLSKLILKLAP
jgi:type II secretory pathway component PulF